MSGPIAVVMQTYELYSGRSITRPSYLLSVWVAFGVSAFLVWLQEHQNVQIERKAKEKAEKDLADTSPKLFLEFSKEHANDFTTYSGLFVRNAGKKAAFKIELCSTRMNGLGLAFENMPIERIDSEKRHFVDLRTGRDGNDGIFRWIGGGPGVQLDSLFDELATDGKEESFRIHIKYRDFDGNEFITPCAVNRVSNFLETKIWCELTKAPGG